jgi:hypothetical protein
MTHGEILTILRDDVVTATTEFRLASDHFVEVFRDCQEKASAPASVGLVYTASAEKARAKDRLHLALDRLHKFETKGIVPLGLGEPRT